MEKKKYSLALPRVLRIEPASQCNLACIHCPTGTINMKREIMKEVVFERISSEIELHKDKIKVIVLYHGGEPLLNSNFYNMVARIKNINNNIFIKTVSNGISLTKKHASDIINSGIDLIEFSLDGATAVESQRIRLKSNTPHIINNIKYLIALKKIHDSVKPEIFIATTQFIRDNISTNFPNEPNVPDWLKETFGDDVAGYKPTYALRWPHMGNSGEFDFFEPVSSMDTDKCDHLINTITIRADGSIVPCCYDLTSKLIMGNILSDSLSDIWNGNKYFLLRESISLKKYISICNTCAVVRPPVYLIPKWDNRLTMEIQKGST